MENLYALIPESLRSGDSLVLDDIDISDTYPASVWTLTLFILDSVLQFDKDATADGDLHDLTLTAAETATFTVGPNTWAWKVTDGTAVTTLANGTIEILPDLTSATDTRTHARKVLDAIEAVIETRASTDQMNYEVAGPGGSRKLSKMSFLELVDIKNQYKTIVAQEESAENVKAGRGSGNKIRTRFA